MVSSEFLRDLAIDAKTKIVLVVIDGVGGLPHPMSGRTELETAYTPNLDALARRGMGGMIDPVGRGITPGSAIAHLSLFGYDPVTCFVGRGAVAASGIGLEMGETDVAARMNFATMDDEGRISDRRAGRIPTERCAVLCALLQEIRIPGIELTIEPVKDYRAVVIFKGDGLCPEVSDSDPEKVELPPKPVEALVPEAERMAEVANEFIRGAREILKDRSPTNMVLTRGYARRPDFPSMSDVYKLNAACIATYPDYRGVSRMVGMTVLETGSEIGDEVETLERHFDEHDFFFFHVKKSDSMGEDGNFEGKVKVIEEADRYIPRILALEPDVIAVTGDHSTPALYEAHSWHPVPVALSSMWCRRDRTSAFSESECSRGALGRFPGTELMALMMANARRLEKLGA